MAVAAEYRGRGIARALLREAETRPAPPAAVSPRSSTSPTSPPSTSAWDTPPPRSRPCCCPAPRCCSPSPPLHDRRQTPPPHRPPATCAGRAGTGRDRIAARLRPAADARFGTHVVG
ncbi:GNAT family N-acetyltransferase [Streptomyces zhihengii]